MKLNFVCIGAQKAGTTTLHDILETHPDIYLPPRKEAQFFDVDERYEKGIKYYFSTFFNTYKSEKYVGNINPNLQLECKSLYRLKECFGEDLKILFILRNPISRSYSHYLMSKKRGYEKFSFRDAIFQEEYRIENPKRYTNYITAEPGHFEKNHFGYIYRSQYSRTIDTLFSLFPSKNIKILFFEDFMSDIESSVKDILEFLEIPYSPELNFNLRSNVASDSKMKIISNILYGPSSIRKVLGGILKEEHKRILFRKIERFNSVPLSKESKKNNEEDENWIVRNYLRNEIIRIEEIFGRVPNSWKIPK